MYNATMDIAIKCLRRAVLDLVAVKTYRPGELPMAMLDAESRAAAMASNVRAMQGMLTDSSTSTARAVSGGTGPAAAPAVPISDARKKKDQKARAKAKAKAQALADNADVTRATEPLSQQFQEIANTAVEPEPRRSYCYFHQAHVHGAGPPCSTMADSDPNVRREHNHAYSHAPCTREEFDSLPVPWQRNHPDYNSSSAAAVEMHVADPAPPAVDPDDIWIRTKQNEIIRRALYVARCKANREAIQPPPDGESDLSLTGMELEMLMCHGLPCNNQGVCIIRDRIGTLGNRTANTFKWYRNRENLYIDYYTVGGLQRQHIEDLQTR